MTSDPSYLRRSDGATIAYDVVAPASMSLPGVVFLHGLMSDRNGTKALALADHCRRKGYGCVRFDMFGHGVSSGRFEDGTISRWTADTIAVLDELTQGPQILVGSSMGGWVMVRTALARAARIAGMVGIAVAPDFTDDMMARELTAAQRSELASKGIVHVQSDYETGPYPITRNFVDDGRRNFVLTGPVAVSCPVRLLHGQRDTVVPYQKSLSLAEKMSGDNVHILLIKDGDHRLSRPQDLAQLCGALDDVISQVRI